MKSPNFENNSQKGMDTELQDIFVSLHQKLSIAFRKKMEDFKFTLLQIETLIFILKNQRPTMKDIATYLNISAPSATALVEHLSNKKLIKRKMDSKDRRTVHIFLTPKCQKLFLTFKEIKNQMFKEMLGNLNENDKKQLAVILKKLIR
jgi:DNA-binding MarR family transcriptional regulator